MLNSLPSDITRQIAQGCRGTGDYAGNGASEFFVLGRGGLPPQPSDPLSTDALIGNESMTRTGGENHSVITNSSTLEPSTSDPLVQAQGWIVNAQGEIELTAYPSNVAAQMFRSIAATCHMP